MAKMDPMLRKNMSVARQFGFTLVELLVVIAIIGILVALLLPAVQAAREAARRAQCVNNLKQHGVALQNFESAKKEFPPGRHGCPVINNYTTCSGNVLKEDGASLFVELLPFLEEQALYEMVNYEKGGIFNDNAGLISVWYTDPDRKQMVSTRPSVMKCPSSPTTATIAAEAFDTVAANWNPADAAAALGSYAGSMGDINVSGLNIDKHPRLLKLGLNSKYVHQYENTGMFVYKKGRKLKRVSDGTSQSFAVGEVKGEDTESGYNGWPYAIQDISGTRTTASPVNTPPGFPYSDSGGLANCKYARSGNNPPAPCYNGAFGSNHPGGAHFVFVDGHVSFIDDAIATIAYQSLSTIGENDTVDGSY
jgi:prepilin-type N-terminal cleavage/methylation domain-containing protein/prepilin-type processing-associated H-X9-DG protein